MLETEEAIVSEVKTLLDNEQSGHGWDHIDRVCRQALKLCQTEPKANVDVVKLAALLHDVDDYKLFGQDAADGLLNARRIMQKYNIDLSVQEKVCNIIGQMGYSKALKGIRPQSLEGKIVSDADMLDAIGALGTIRCLAYALARCNSSGMPIFNAEVFPEMNLSAEEYKQPNRKSDNFINHFFEKMLKLEKMMLTRAGREEASIRQRFMLDFLQEFFREQDLDEWLVLLENFRTDQAA